MPKSAVASACASEPADGSRPAAEHPDILAQIRRAALQHGPGFDPTPLHLTLLLYRMVSVSDRAHAIELAPLGVTGSQFNVLTVLYRSPDPMSMGALARAVSVRPANLTTVVNRLRDMDYVLTETDPTDRRSSLVQISPAGKELLNRFMAGHWTFLNALFAGLDHTRRQQLIDLLTNLVLVAEGDLDDREPELSPDILLAAHHGHRTGEHEGAPTRPIRGRRPRSRPSG